MKFKQQVILKHDHGITAQWISEDWSNMAIATYYQQEKEGKNVDGETVKIKTWVLGNCSGPWTGVTPDGKELTIIPGYDNIRNEVSGEATLILTCINGTVGGKKAFSAIWSGSTIGFDGFWPEDKTQ
jgi:hypothetical protein